MAERFKPSETSATHTSNTSLPSEYTTQRLTARLFGFAAEQVAFCPNYIPPSEDLPEINSTEISVVSRKRGNLELDDPFDSEWGRVLNSIPAVRESYLERELIPDEEIAMEEDHFRLTLGQTASAAYGGVAEEQDGITLWSERSSYGFRFNSDGNITVRSRRSTDDYPGLDKKEKYPIRTVESPPPIRVPAWERELRPGEVAQVTEIIDYLEMMAEKQRIQVAQGFRKVEIYI